MFKRIRKRGIKRVRSHLRCDFCEHPAIHSYAPMGVFIGDGKGGEIQGKEYEYWAGQGTLGCLAHESAATELARLNYRGDDAPAVAVAEA